METLPTEKLSYQSRSVLCHLARSSGTALDVAVHHRDAQGRVVGAQIGLPLVSGQALPCRNLFHSAARGRFASLGSHCMIICCSSSHGWRVGTVASCTSRCRQWHMWTTHTCFDYPWLVLDHRDRSDVVPWWRANHRVPKFVIEKERSAQLLSRDWLYPAYPCPALPP